MDNLAFAAKALVNCMSDDPDDYPDMSAYRMVRDKCKYVEDALNEGGDWYIWYRVCHFPNGIDGERIEVRPDCIDDDDFYFTDIEEARAFRDAEIKDGCYEASKLKIVEERRRIVT
jgi:hypothetical protein